MAGKTLRATMPTPKRITREEYDRLMAKRVGEQTETMILQQIRDYLRTLGWFVVRHQQGLGCHKGLSDLTVVKDGRTIWLEVKTAKGKQSEYQQKFQADIEEHGGKYVIARSVDDVVGL